MPRRWIRGRGGEGGGRTGRNRAEGEGGTDRIQIAQLEDIFPHGVMSGGFGA